MATGWQVPLSSMGGRKYSDEERLSEAQKVVKNSSITVLLLPGIGGIGYTGRAENSG